MMCGIARDPGLYKPLRPSQLLQSNERVVSAMKVFNEDFINPFRLEVNRDELVNISSGVPLSINLANDLLSIPNKGIKQYEQFTKERLVDSPVTKFHQPIPRNNIKGFKQNNVRHSISKDKIIKSIEVNRDILSKMLSISVKSGKPIDFEKALQHPLSPVPLTLCHADGNMRKTKKSDLMEIILKLSNQSSPPLINKENTVYVIDLMAAVHTIRELSNTFEDLAFNIIKIIPSGYKQVYIVADTYKVNSIKSSERSKRGLSEKILITSSKSKIPREFSKLLNNNANKKRMIEVLFGTIECNRVKMLNLLKINKIIMSMEDNCRLLTLADAVSVHSLETNQEDADTKVFLHTYKILKETNNDYVVIRSHSGDTDILVLGVSLFPEGELDNGTGKSRKLIWFGNVEFSTGRRKALLGFHAFTGNDYNASFFRKSKVTCWKILANNSKFEDTFSALGEHLEISVFLNSSLEEYVCRLYRCSEKSVNCVRYKMFEKKQCRENKIPD